MNFLVIILSYILGSINFAYIMAKVKVITRRRWQQHETQFLIENQSMSCDEVAFYLGRTPWGVYERRRKMNLSTAEISSVARTDIPSVARADICLVSAHNADVSEVSIVALSQCSSRR